MFNVTLLIAALVVSLFTPPPVHTNAQDPEKASDKAAVAASSTSGDAHASQRALGDTQLIAALESVLAEVKSSPTATPRQVKALEQILADVRDRQFMASRQHRIQR